MAHLRDIDPLFPELLKAAEADGLVTVKQHKEFDLWIANYTPRAAYDRAWNVVTKASRGLIWDADERIIARPFAKFFNWDEPSAPNIPAGAALVSQKYDGSLGILYVGDDDEDYIATRGSFHSEQAERGTEIFRRLVEETGEEFDATPDKTYLFEIIYPENRVVLDYGGQERLVLIDVVDNDTGKSDVDEFDRAPWVDIAVKRVLPSFHHTLIEEIADDEEGFVLYWPHADVRVKMKGPEYVRLHKIITHVSNRTIWEYLAAKRPLDTLLESVPDEFYHWVRKTATDLRAAYAEIEGDVREQFNLAMALAGWERFGHESRKEFALLVKDFKYKSVLFRMWDDKPYDDIIWKILRPQHARPFWMGEE